MRCRDVKEAEVELFKDETVRITLILKKSESEMAIMDRYADKHLMSCVCRFYSVEGEITNLALTVETGKRVEVFSMQRRNTSKSIHIPSPPPRFRKISPRVSSWL